MHHLNKCLGVIALLLAIGCRAEEEAPVTSLIHRLQSLHSLHGQYLQQTEGARSQPAQTRQGELWVKAPGMFRIESAQQTLVSNGVDFWSFDEDLEQLIISQLNQDISQVPILLLTGSAGDIEGQYRVQFYQDENADNFVLEPRSTTSLFDRVTLSFTQNSPSMIVITDSLNQRTVIQFSDLDINQPIDPVRFELVVPPGTDVIDERQP